MKKQQKELTKFTDCTTGAPLYLDISQAIGVRSYHYNNGAYNTLTGSSPGNPQTVTQIMFLGNHIDVAEHITEVIALLEGRDPAPSKILFNKNVKPK